MSISIKKILELILLLGVAAALLLWLIPWPRKMVELPSNAELEEGPESSEQETSLPGEPAAEEEIARLFGWRKRITVSRTGAKPAPQEAPWLRSVGFVVDKQGRKFYLFKDSRQDQVLSLRVGTESRGWKLLGMNPRSFLLEFQGKEYIIKRSR